MKRTIAYIDGFNLYHGLRDKGWKYFYWLNIKNLMQHMLRPHQQLTSTKYFTSIVHYPRSKHRRQAVYLEALQTLRDFKIYYGHYLSEEVVCSNCGYTYQTYHEKMTDVNIATELLSDAFQDEFDVALLVTADSDLVGPIQTVHRLFNKKRLVVVFPPARYSNALKRVASAYTHIGRNVLSRSVFPDQVVKPDGFVLRRPARWR